ncbi:hypothetical protein FDG2_5103 [Candidatus Protofrankia californiensis]|uniref:Uncharacterized protein n=1 Tax=Candidatus Protofrankia californiensis TaxID=1839754 RepID=A0A1C3PAV8_9ACTN|nr:hypothetical protein FDG2_5103 [Candidatus Protofrankia californiensis]
MAEAGPLTIRDLINSDVAVRDAPIAELVGEVRRLHDRIHRWSPASWREPCSTSGSGAISSGSAVGTRADRVRALAVELAGLGCEAGSGVPAGVGPPRLADHALADQIVVLATDVIEALVADAAGDTSVSASSRRNDLAKRARVAVHTARMDLSR